MIRVGMQVLVLADDTTGALEVGALLAASGLRTAVTLEADLEGLERYAALVVDAATRHLEAVAARQRIRDLAAKAGGLGIQHVYLKTDSTLRGPIGAQFEALLDVWPERPLVYVPAYPAMGRQVVAGRLLVDGRALDETAFAGDPREPARESRIPRLLEAGCRARVVNVSCAEQLERLLGDDVESTVLLCDGTREGDLAAIAEVVARSARPCLAAGAGGFARYWMDKLATRRDATPARHVARRWLVINGSLHPCSRQQIARCGLPRIRAEAGARQEFAWAVLDVAEQPAADPAAMAQRIAGEARRIVEGSAVDGLVVFGGDTVRAVMEALGARLIEPAGELLAGVPISRIPAAGLALVSKAGGFGPPDVVAQIRQQLEQ